MRAVFLTLYLMLAFSAAQGAELDDFLASPDNKAETHWPGIIYKIMLIQRLPPDRLVVGLFIKATAQAPANPTLIGIPVEIPANPDPILLREGRYHPKPYSFDSSLLTDDLTGTQYQVLPPNRFGKQVFQPGSIVAWMRPYQTVVVTMQFTLPPPPSAGTKQTVSILFSNAVAPIAHIPIPTPEMKYGSPAPTPK